jgi:dephospho-CoA kinase
MRMSVILGITGSFGSGKSTVAGMFRDLGVPVIDADQVARDVVQPGTPGLADVVAAFGDAVLDAEGRLDRKRMADLVFADEESRRRLNAIVHPRVGQGIAKFIAEHAGAPLIALEIPLLLEGGRRAPVDKILVVTTSEESRHKRLQSGGFTREEIEARLRTQMPQEEKIRRADHVIENDGDLEQTRRAVQQLAERYGIGVARPS